MKPNAIKQKQITVIIVDDHPLFRMGIKATLNEEPETFSILGEAGNETELQELLKENKPDIIILDIVLPEKNGIAIARTIKDKDYQQKILLLSSETTQENFEQALMIPIDGFIDKMSVEKDLTDALHAIHSGEQFFGKRLSILHKEVISTQINLLPKSKKQKLFTNREEEIVKLLCQGEKAEYIARQLHISPRTVTTHTANIYKKLNINNVIDLFRLAVKYGIVTL